MKTPEDVVPDLCEWPESWAYERKDVGYGQGVLDAMRPFMVFLIDKGLARKTVKRHMDNLWLLGGEVIRWVNDRKKHEMSPADALFWNLDEEGGPYCRHLHSEYEEQSYHGTCRKLYKFLVKNIPDCE